MRRGFLLLAVAYWAISAFAQPASDLLQSGIYSQDTVGDLDAAIRIYRQILGSGTGMRLYAAHAQYRLGVCLLRKGDSAAAAEVFQTVIREYSDQPALVARARESLPPGNRLLRAPWPPTEVAEYRWTIPGVKEGWSICRIGSPSTDASKVRIQMAIYTPRLYMTQVDLDRGTMEPLLVSYRTPSEGNVRFDYPSGLEPSKARYATYEFGELLYLLRRMPLALGWSSTIPLIAEQHAPFTVKATVIGLEDVVVPAGSFKCFRVQVTGDMPGRSAVGTDWTVSRAGETFWYGATGARPLVRIESGRFLGELASLRTAEQIGTSSYHDPEAGYSFTVPAGWIFHPRGSFNPPGTSVDLLDPDARAWLVISGKAKVTDRDQIEPELLAGAEERLHQRQRAAKNYGLRGSMQHGQMGGHASISWTADYIVNGRKWVEYLAWVQSEKTRANLQVQIEASEFDRYQQRIQPILNSFRMP
jgi:hypothetical protein